MLLSALDRLLCWIFQCVLLEKRLPLNFTDGSLSPCKSLVFYPDPAVASGVQVYGVKILPSVIMRRCCVVIAQSWIDSHYHVLHRIHTPSSPNPIPATIKFSLILALVRPRFVLERRTVIPKKRKPSLVDLAISSNEPVSPCPVVFATPATHFSSSKTCNYHSYK